MKAPSKQKRKFFIKQPARRYFIVMTNEYLNIKEYPFETLLDLMRALPKYIKTVRDGKAIGLAITSITGKGEMEYLCELDQISKRSEPISEPSYIVTDVEI